MSKNLYYETISSQTMQELDAFLEQHPNDKVDYWTWRDALRLSSKVYKELVESIEEYGMKFDKIFAKYNKEKLHEVVYMNLVNQELENIGVVKNEEVWKKIELLCKKRYYFK